MRWLLVLLASVLLSCPAPQDTRVVIDQTHDNLHEVFEGQQTYLAFYELLVDEGYPVDLWESSEPIEETWLTLVGCPAWLCGIEVPRADIDVLVFPLPLLGMRNAFYQSFVEQWVAEGGALLLIGDHWPNMRAVNPMAELFGARFRLTDSIVGDGVSHCVPGETSCPVGQLTFLPTDNVFVPMFHGVEYLTTYAGTSIESLGADIEAWVTTGEMGFQTIGTQTPRNNEIVVGLIRHGDGVVVLAAEAAMFSCRQWPGFPVGWCPDDPSPAGDYNDNFVLNMFSRLRLEKLLP
jgi:hypothetical protein